MGKAVFEGHLQLKEVFIESFLIAGFTQRIIFCSYI